ncbi:MAG: hypothetical protein LIP16_20630 [Clostridium sp.]|nr:hypothetical protein [Clostridium sp.]
MITISEKELLDMMVLERIQMLITQMDSLKADEKGSVAQLIDQAEVILKHLPEADRDILNRYLEHLVDHMAEEEPCLYVGGFKDGIRTMKLISNL